MRECVRACVFDLCACEGAYVRACVRASVRVSVMVSDLVRSLTVDSPNNHSEVNYSCTEQWVKINTDFFVTK